MTLCRKCDVCQLTPDGDVMQCAIVYDRLLERFREAVLSALDSCNRDPIVVTMMLARVAGLTEQETADMVGASQSAVSRNLARIARNNPALARELHKRWPLVEGMAPPAEIAGSDPATAGVVTP